MKFTDRNVPNPIAYRITEAGETGESYVALIQSDCGEIYEEGTPLDAQTLNDALDEKQDKLSTKDGKIVITQNADGKSEIKMKNALPPDYTPMCKEIISSDFIPNYSTWTAEFAADSFATDEVYEMQIGDEKYKSFKLEFEIDNYSDDYCVDVMPEIRIIIKDEQNNENSLCFAFNRHYGGCDIYKITANGIAYIMGVGRNSEYFKSVCLIRTTQSAEGELYTLFVDGNKEGDCSIPVKQSYCTVKVGTKGCKADIRYWKIDGEI